MRKYNKYEGQKKNFSKAPKNSCFEGRDGFMQKKENLVHEVLQNGKSIHSSAKKIGIKYSTAKAIVKRFKQSGTLAASKNEQRLSRQDHQDRESHADLPIDG